MNRRRRLPTFSADEKALIAEAETKRADFDRRVALLSERHQKTIAIRVVERKPISAIAKHFDLTPGWARKMLNAAIAALKKIR